MFVKFTPYLIFYSLLNKTCIFLNISSESVYFSKSFFISFKISSVLDLIINLMLNSSFNLNPLPLLGPKMSTSLPYFSAIVFYFSLILFMASLSTSAFSDTNVYVAILHIGGKLSICLCFISSL